MMNDIWGNRVSLYRMRILDPTETQPLTFLYKLDSQLADREGNF